MPRKVLKRGSLRAAFRLATPVALLLSVCAAAPAAAQNGETPGAAMGAAMGLAHVDLMDLHLERVPGGAPRPREILSEGEISERYAHAAAAGAAYNRWSLYWDLVENSAGYDWSVADGIASRDVAAGVPSLAILQGTPAHYATAGLFGAPVPDVGGHTRDNVDALDADGGVSLLSSPPQRLYEPAFVTAAGTPTDDPALAVDENPNNPWARFVGAAVARYRPGGDLAVALGWPAGAGIRTWEIGNEPNLRHFWSGSAADFARFLEVGYLVAKRHDPDATVIHGGIADEAGADAWYRQLLDALVRRATESPLPERYGYYFDAAGWHWYTYPSLLLTGPAKARRLLSEAGLPDKPIWVTELGVPIWSEHPGPCWDPNSPWRATVPEQSGYVWQATTEALAADVDVLIFFQAYDDCGNGPQSYDAFGLIRNHASNQCWTPPEGQPCWRLDPALAGVPRPAYDAFEVAVRELAGTELLWRPPREEGFWQRVLLYRPPDERVTVAWNWLRADQEVALGATGPEATLLTLDASGDVITVPSVPTDGAHVVTLPGTTNQNNPGSNGPVMAGRPVILVERDAYAPFRAEVEALPEVSPPRLDLTVAAADGGTGVGAIQVFVSETAPDDPSAWSPLTGVLDWVGEPRGGHQAVAFSGVPGRTYYFAARARDRAGNWTDLPDAPQAVTRVAGTPEPGAPTATAPSPEPTSSQSTSTPTPRSTVTATPRQTAATTDGPPPVLSESAHLPLVLLRHNVVVPRPTPTPAPTPAPNPTPACRDISVNVVGPRADVLALGGVWTVRALSPAGQELDRQTVPLGEPACVAGDAARLEGWAQVQGYLTFEPQDLALSRDLVLAVSPNRLVNGGFEAGLSGWERSGSTAPQVSSEALAGRGAVVLGADFAGQPELGGGGNSTMGQDVSLPLDAATVSLRYRFDSRETCEGGDCGHLDRFEVIVVDLDAPGAPATYLTGRDGLRDPAPAWTHLWYDLSAWSGHRVRLLINLYQPDPDDPSRLWLDNVSVGPARPAGG